MTTNFGPVYQKINTLFKRDTSIKGNPVIPWDWSCDEFAYLKNMPWRWTEKIDGTNTRLYWDGRTVTLGGRTDNAQIPAMLTDAIRSLGLLDTEKWAKKWPLFDPDHPERSNPQVTIFGEGYGPRIQKGGGLYREDVSFIVFDVRIGDFWLTPENVKDVADGFGLETVPEHGLFSLVDAWEKIVKGELRSQRFPEAHLEGIVGTPAVPLYNRKGERLITKVKQRDYDFYRLIKENSN